MWLSVLGIGILGILLGIISNLFPLFGSITFNILMASLYFAGLTFYQATQASFLAPFYTASVIAFSSGYLIGTFGSKISKQFTGVGV